MVNQALAIAWTCSGLLGRFKGGTQAEARLELRPMPPSGATYNVEASRLIGRREGLQKSKDDLMRLARAHGLHLEGKTMDQLKHLIRP